MSRRFTRRYGLAFLGRAGQQPGPPPPPVNPTIAIASVSQTYGKAAGGSVLYVLGSNFVSGMTALTAGGSAFGTVAAITENACQITTTGGSAGTTDTWHFHGASRVDSSGQTFGYVSPPVQSAITPSTGPGTITNTGVVFTVSGLGASGSNIPITGTVGSGTIHSDTVSVTASNSFTADFDAPGVGSDAVAVTVDGVAATGSVTFTGNTAPVFTSATNIGTAGGNVIIRGANYVNTGGGTQVSASVLGALTTTYNSATQLTVAVPAHAAGSFDITITNPDLQTAFAPGGLIISSAQDPGATFGANLSGWYRADTGFTTDKSGTGNSLTAHGSPTTTTSAAFNGQPYYSLNGSTQYFERGTFAHSASAGAACFIATVMRYVSAPGSITTVASYNTTSNEIQMQTSGILRQVGGGLAAAWGSAVLNTPLQIYGYDTATPGGSNGASAVSIGNATAIVTSGAVVGTLPASGGFGIGARQTGAQPATVDTAEVVVVNVVPNSTQLAQLAQYFQLRYQIEADPTFTSATLVNTSGGGSRIQGTNFISGVTVSASGGIGAMTTTFVSPTVLEVTVPAASAGSYDLTITNPDGGVLFVSGGLVVSATDNVMSKLGLKVVGWYRGDQVTTSAGAVLTMSDMSNRGNVPGTITSVTQTSSDSNFNNQSTLNFNGTSSIAVVTNFALNSSTAGQLFYWVVVRTATTTAFQMIVSLSATSFPELRTSNSASGHAQMSWSSTTADSPSANGANLTRAVYGSNTGGTSGGGMTLGCAVSNEAPGTGSGTAPGTMPTTANLGIGARSTSTNFCQMALAELIVTNTIPSAGELSFLESYAQTRYSVP